MAIVYEQTAGLAAGVDTEVYTVGAGNKGMVNIVICKKTAGTAVVSMSVTVGAVVTNYESNFPISNGGPPLVWTREILPAGAIVKVVSDVTGVDVTVSGVEGVA